MISSALKPLARLEGPDTPPDTPLRLSPTQSFEEPSSSDKLAQGHNVDPLARSVVKEFGVGTKASVLVLGSGNFGSCLADHLADAGHDVTVWARDPLTVKMFNEEHRNRKYLKDHIFPTNLCATGPELPTGAYLRSFDVIIVGVPTQSLASVIRPIFAEFGNIADLPLTVYVSKGIEKLSNKLPLEIVADIGGKEAARVATFLSGPSFAAEVVQRQPTQVSIASLSVIHAERVAALFHRPHFRCYVQNDPMGVEICAALKNVYAIASGVAAGLGYAQNTRAGLVTRCLAEMSRVAVAFGCHPVTLMSLAGVGDLFLTCSSEKSRNFTVGYRLGKGEQLDHILATLGSVAEGVETAASVHDFVKKINTEAPISERVYALLYEGETARKMADELMGLPRLLEGDLPEPQDTPLIDRFRTSVGLADDYYPQLPGSDPSSRAPSRPSSRPPSRGASRANSFVINAV